MSEKDGSFFHLMTDNNRGYGSVAKNTATAANSQIFQHNNLQNQCNFSFLLNLTKNNINSGEKLFTCCVTSGKSI